VPRPTGGAPAPTDGELGHRIGVGSERHDSGDDTIGRELAERVASVDLAFAEWIFDGKRKHVVAERRRIYGNGDGDSFGWLTVARHQRELGGDGEFLQRRWCLRGAAGAACTPGKLVMAMRQGLATTFRSPVGLASESRGPGVRRFVGIPRPAATVIASFSNSDPPLGAGPRRVTGIYFSATWKPAKR